MLVDEDSRNDKQKRYDLTIGLIITLISLIAIEILLVLKSYLEIAFKGTKELVKKVKNRSKKKKQTSIGD